ncbi:MAG TPA: hypothetical protein VF469_24805 [Kofleriaceae bacterium]
MSRGVKIATSREGVTLTSHNPDLGEVREELEAEYNTDSIAIGFNPARLPMVSPLASTPGAAAPAA